MTREELNYLIHKGKITVTGLVDKKGNVNPKLGDKDLDDVANAYITVPGITDGTSEGKATSDWIKTQKAKDAKEQQTISGGSNPRPHSEEPSGGENEVPALAGAPVIIVTGLDEPIACNETYKAGITIKANDYAGSNVKMTWVAEGATVKIANKDVWTLKSLKDKELVLAITPEENAKAYTINFELVDDQKTVLATKAVEFSVIQKITTFELLKAAIAAGGDVVLDADIDVTEQLEVTNTVVLDLNGHNLSNSNDIWDDNAAWSILSVNGGNLTVNGKGTVHAKENDCYPIDVRNGGNLTVNDGVYEGNIHCVYVFEGHADINGGNWSVQQKYSNDKPDEFVINCYDKNFAAGTASVAITGGSFVGFNPGDNQAEIVNVDDQGVRHNSFLAAGYTVEQNDNIYTVVAE